ncbi:MAG TPA: transcription termination factor NusA [Chloroflexota bacterium]|nr:transcription termination factor NusA [Chloroflexota bacterium]
MGRSELVTAIRQLTAERDLPVEVVIEAVENALAQTYKRQYGQEPDVSVKLDTDTGEFRVYAPKKVVIEVRDEANEISLKDAQRYPGNPGLNEIIEVEVTPPNFGRIAAQTAKQTILQRIQEAERDLIYEEYADREGEIVNGIIERIEQPRGIIVNLGKAEALLPPAEQVRSERYRIGQRLKVYVTKVDRGIRVPQLIVSRANRGLVRRLFEVEVPEIFNGTVELKAIAREAGSRTKVAVTARQEGVDAVGACVGMRGVRIQNVVNELNGEKIDVVQWDESPERFVANALSPATVTAVEVNPNERRAVVTVPDNQLSLAIGREGQNARLAAKLTGWRVDIRKESDVLAETEQDDLQDAAANANASAAQDVLEEEEAVTMDELLAQVPVEAMDEG